MNPIELKAHATQLLSKHPCPGITATALGGVLAAGQVVDAGPATMLCQEGEPPRSLFFLLTGEVRVSRRDPQGRPRELTRIQAPAMVGHMALIDGSNRSASCLTIADATYVVLDRPGYERLLDDPNTVGAALRRLLLTSLTRQLSAGNTRIRELMLGPKATPSAKSRAALPASLAKTPRDSVARKAALQSPTADPAAAAAPAAAAPEAPPASANPDISAEDLLEVADILEGWEDISEEDLASVSTVMTEDHARNRRS